MVEQWQCTMFSEKSERFSVPNNKIKFIKEEHLDELSKVLSNKRYATSELSFNTRKGYLEGLVTPRYNLTEIDKKKIQTALYKFNKKVVEKKYYKLNDDDVLIPLRKELTDFEKYLMSLTLIKELRTEIGVLKSETAELDYYNEERDRLLNELKEANRKINQLSNQVKILRSDNVKLRKASVNELLPGDVIFFNYLNKVRQSVVIKNNKKLNYVEVRYKGRDNFKVGYEYIKLNGE